MTFKLIIFILFLLVNLNNKLLGKNNKADYIISQKVSQKQILPKENIKPKKKIKPDKLLKPRIEMDGIVISSDNIILDSVDIKAISPDISIIIITGKFKIMGGNSVNVGDIVTISVAKKEWKLFSAELYDEKLKVVNNSVIFRIPNDYKNNKIKIVMDEDKPILKPLLYYGGVTIFFGSLTWISVNQISYYYYKNEKEKSETAYNETTNDFDKYYNNYQDNLKNQNKWAERCNDWKQYTTLTIGIGLYIVSRFIKDLSSDTEISYNVIPRIDGNYSYNFNFSYKF